MSRKIISLIAPLILLAACSNLVNEPTTERFTIAVIPDTQNAIDYTRQKSEGFALDSSDIFIEQMRHIAGRSAAQGGDIVFVASVGDVWQHPSQDMDPAHLARGIDAGENPFFNSGSLLPKAEALSIEIPKAIEGYRLISQAGIPFGVAPGNHDYDAIWPVAAFPPNLEKPRDAIQPNAEDMGTLHLGGLANFRSAFGEDTDFFRDKSWYLDGFEGGGSSAQLFEAGGYQFLHFAFEMHAGDHVLAWAQTLIDAHPGIPTIITTHDYMNRFGERSHTFYFNLAEVDPGYNNSSEQIFQKFIATNDQIFLVLCGHFVGQAFRIDENQAGHAVYQILADYQERGQAGIDAGQPRTNAGNSVGIGDGWYRELRFDLSRKQPRIVVKTYSSHYNTYSGELDSYSAWYKKQEQPQMTEAEFYAADDYIIELTDFHQRFKPNTQKP